MLSLPYASFWKIINMFTFMSQLLGLMVKMINQISLSWKVLDGSLLKKSNSVQTTWTVPIRLVQEDMGRYNTLYHSQGNIRILHVLINRDHLTIEMQFISYVPRFTRAFSQIQGMWWQSRDQMLTLFRVLKSSRMRSSFCLVCIIGILLAWLDFALKKVSRCSCTSICQMGH